MSVKVVGVRQAEASSVGSTADPRVWASRLRALAAIAAGAAVAYWIAYESPLIFLTVMTVAMAYALLGLGTNILFGIAGLVPFGQAMIFGIGAYSAGLLREHELPALAVLGIGIAVGAFAEMLLMGALSRFNHISFSILTLVVGQLLVVYVTKTHALGGEDGLAGIPRGSFFGVDLNGLVSFWWYSVGVVVVGCLFYAWVSRSVFGLWLRAIRADEERVETLRGHRYWLRAFAGLPAGALCGLGGALYAQYGGVASPAVLDFTLSGTALFMCLLGGRGYVLGPVVGALIYSYLTQDLLYGTAYPELVLGLLLTALVLVFPDGLLSLTGIAKRWWRRPGRWTGGAAPERSRG